MRVRKSRAALRGSEARFRTLAEATREEVVIHDGEKIADANETFLRMHGFSSMRGIIGREIMDLIAPEGRAIIADSLGRTHSGAYENIGIRPDGSRFPIEIEGRAIECGGQRMRVAISRNLTRRRADEAPLGESEVRFRRIAAALPAMVFVASEVGGNVYTNTRFQNYTGLPADALLGDGWISALHPDEVPRAIASWRHAIDSSDPYKGEYRFRGRDGAWRWFAASPSGMRIIRLFAGMGPAPTLAINGVLKQLWSKVKRGFVRPQTMPAWAWWLWTQRTDTASPIVLTRKSWGCQTTTLSADVWRRFCPNSMKIKFGQSLNKPCSVRASSMNCHFLNQNMVWQENVFLELTNLEKPYLVIPSSWS